MCLSMMTFFIELGIIFGMALLVAMLSLFLEMCMAEGNIFSFWMTFLEKNFLDSWWFKPLGGCVLCMNVWICLISFPGIVLALGVSCWWWLPYILGSNTLLRILWKIAD